jgi:hypothetical protein
MGCGTYLESEKLRTVCTSKYSGEFLIARHRGIHSPPTAVSQIPCTDVSSGEGTAHWRCVHRYVPASVHTFSAALMCIQSPNSRLFSRGKEDWSVADISFTISREKANICGTFAA